MKKILLFLMLFVSALSYGQNLHYSPSSTRQGFVPPLNGNVGDYFNGAGGFTTLPGSTLSNIYEATSFGILFDSLKASATANTAAWRTMIATVPNGSLIRLPAGTCYINDTILISGKSIQIFGNANALQIGSANGLQPGNYGASTQIIQATQNKNAFVVNIDPPTATGLDKGVSFQGFAILADTVGAPTLTAGSGIKFEKGGFFYLKDMVFNFFYTDVNIADNSTYWTIDHCNILGFQQYGISIKCPASPDQGDWSIFNCSFYPDFHRAAKAGIYWESNGGMKIFGNKFNGGAFGASYKMTYGVSMNLKGQTSDMLLYGNSMENIDSSAVYFVSDTFVFQNMQVVGNQVSGQNAKGPAIKITGNPGYPNRNIMIDGNIFGDFGTPQDTTIEIANFAYVVIGHNSINTPVYPFKLTNCSNAQIDYTTYNLAADVGTNRSVNGTEYWQISNPNAGTAAVGQFQIDNDGGGQMGMNLTSSTNTTPSNGKLFSAKRLSIVSDNSVSSGGTDPIVFQAGGSGTEFGRIISTGTATTNQFAIGSTSIYGSMNAPIYINRSVNSSTGIAIQNSNAGTSTSMQLQLNNGTAVSAIALNGHSYSSGYSIQAADQLVFYNTKDIGLLADGGKIQFATGATSSSSNPQVGSFETNGNFLVGSSTNNSTAQVQITKTTAQLALHYDASNYATETVNSGGNLTITPTGGQLISGGTLSYGTAPVITDANYTLVIGKSYIELPTITANRTLTLPSPGQGAIIEILNNNAAGFTWSFASTVKDPAGATVTNITNQTYVRLVKGASNWIKTN